MITFCVKKRTRNVKALKYELSMSSKWASSSNTYEAAVEDGFERRCITNPAPASAVQSHWITATLASPVGSWPTTENLQKHPLSDGPDMSF